MIGEGLLGLGLNFRELEIVSLVVRGDTNEEIGEKLFIATQTVKFHLTKIYEKLCIDSNRPKLILFCLPYFGWQEPQYLIDERTEVIEENINTPIEGHCDNEGVVILSRGI